MDFSSLLGFCVVPTDSSKVYKDETIYSFENPESEDGIFISLRSFLSVGKSFLNLHHQKSGDRLFLNHKRIRHFRVTKDDNVNSESPVSKKPTRMAIGVTDGFSGSESQFSFEEINKLYVMPEGIAIDLPCEGLPEKLSASIAGVLAADSAWKLEEMAALSNTWDGEVIVESKYARDLKQLDNGVKIRPHEWQCVFCDLRENLWLNLTDGTVLCGRQFFDGSGGNNHAVEHYQKTGFPLAVKLGTITTTSADVFSYGEDAMVLDPLLPQHLSHFGIDVQTLTKTDKTMNELEIDLNMKIHEWDIIQESGNKLEPVYGPGFTGIHNLGNSCYMNSVLQVLFSIPSFDKCYFGAFQSIAESTDNAVDDFNLQMAKIGHGLLSGNYSFYTEKPGEYDIVLPQGIRPYMFKHLAGKKHVEFSTKRQQDAFEYLLHLFSLIEQNSVGSVNPSHVSMFEVVDKIQCLSSKKFKVAKRKEYSLTFPIPLDQMTNKSEYELYIKSERNSKDAFVRPSIPLQACLEAFGASETIDDFHSSAINAATSALKMTRLATFPDVLILHARKFEVDENWLPKKLDVSLEVPDTLDLSFLRYSGLQPGEEELPESKPEDLASSGPQIDQTIVNQVMAMGFSENACIKAVINTNNQGVEAAMNWIMDHMDDADFNSPMPQQRQSGSFVPDDNALAMIMSMGFNRDQATLSLSKCDNQLERAVDWIFSHQDELNQGDNSSDMDTKATPALTDGSPIYRLFAFISHMGTSTQTGHYVCHIRKGNDWFIYNDNNVCRSERPPRELAYLYFYSRV